MTTVMALSFYTLKRLQHIPNAQKIGLASLFSIATFVILFDILRSKYALGVGVVALDSIWDILKPSIAVIISALPVYRALLSTSKKQETTAYRNIGPTSRDRHCHQSDHELTSIAGPRNGADERYHPDTSRTTYTPIIELKLILRSPRLVHLRIL
jgi:hypothetical protein